eukprot:6472718-Karenia_brevis.AAC.1
MRLLLKPLRQDAPAPLLKCGVGSSCRYPSSSGGHSDGPDVTSSSSARLVALLLQGFEFFSWNAQSLCTSISKHKP